MSLELDIIMYMLRSIIPCLALNAQIYSASIAEFLLLYLAGTPLILCLTLKKKLYPKGFPNATSEVFMLIQQCK